MSESVKDELKYNTRELMMTYAEEWATGIRASARLKQWQKGMWAQDEPSILIPTISKNSVLCGAPIELYSKEIPVWRSKTKKGVDLLPIDILYGCYDPDERSIEIYKNSIQQGAKTLNAETEDFLKIIRYHEYAHAIVHLGNRIGDTRGLKNFSPDEKGIERTDWTKFSEERLDWFKGLPPRLHELLAQGLTYSALNSLSDSTPEESKKLINLFDALEEKQPEEYRLSPEVKKGGKKADWSLILDAVRGDLTAGLKDDLELEAGIEALICSFS